MKVVTGTYHDEKSAGDAIQGLVNAGVPVDEISVVVSDASGEHEVPIRERSSVEKGAVVGGSIGAVLGGLTATLVATGVIVAPGLTVLAAGPIVAFFEGALAGGSAGYGLGLLEGLDFWKVDVDLHAEDLVNGAALIAVRSDDLYDAAKEVFERTNADRIVG